MGWGGAFDTFSKKIEIVEIQSSVPEPTYTGVLFHYYGKISKLRPPFGLPKSGLISEVVLISDIIS